MLNVLFLWSWGHHAEQNQQVIACRTGVVPQPQPLALLAQEGTKQRTQCGAGQGLGGWSKPRGRQERLSEDLGALI